MQLYMYISYYLAIGAVINLIGIVLVISTAYYYGRLTVRCDIQRGNYNSEEVNKEVNKELNEIRKSFNDIRWWCIWYIIMLLLWPKAIILYGRKVCKLVKDIHNLKKELN